MVVVVSMLNFTHTYSIPGTVLQLYTYFILQLVGSVPGVTLHTYPEDNTILGSLKATYNYSIITITRMIST